MSGSRTTGSPPPEIGAVAVALPDRVAQADVAAVAASLHPQVPRPRVDELFANAGIEHRHLVRPLDWYRTAHPWPDRLTASADEARRLGVRAATDAMARAGVTPDDIDTLVFVSTTVVRSPNLDVDLVAALGLRADVRRVPLFGTASLGGVVGSALAADLVRGDGVGDACALVVVTEVNSLMFVPGDLSPQGGAMESLVTLALFSDGAAALVVRPPGGARASGPHTTVRVRGRHSTLVPESVGVMGFDPTTEGLRWRLSPDVPEVAGSTVAASVAAALEPLGRTVADLDHVLVHPGGARVLDAVERELGLAPGGLVWSRRVMADRGNLSSVTVLAVLEAFLASGPAPGLGILTAMGPGFGYEHLVFDVVASD